MEFALGILCWEPRAFWEATMHELNAANDAYVRNTTPAQKAEPMKRDEFEELKKRLGK